MSNHMKSTRLKLATILASSAAVAANAFADVAYDPFAGTMNTAVWSKVQTYNKDKKSKVKIVQSAGEVRVLGKGGRAAYLLKSKVDWNDSFVVSFQLDLRNLEFSSAADVARVGLGLGFGAAADFAAPRGYSNGVQLEVVSNQSYTSVRLVARNAGQDVMASEPVTIPDGFHTFELYWYADADNKMLDIRAYIDGDTNTPVASLYGLPSTFNNKLGKGMTMALFGCTTSGAKIEAAFDEFDFAGDFRSSSDGNDNGWNDTDPNDEDEPVYEGGTPDVPSTYLIYFSDALRRVDSHYNGSMAAIETHFDGTYIHVTARESDTQVRDFRFDAWNSNMVTGPVRAATPAEAQACALVSHIDQVMPIDLVERVQWQDAPNMRWARAWLDAGTRQWRFDAASATGQPFHFDMRADGLIHGDGNASTSLYRWQFAIETAEDSRLGFWLSSRMVQGALEITMMPYFGATEMDIVRIDPDTGATLSVTHRAVTEQDTAVAWDISMIRLSDRWTRAMQAAMDQAVVSIEYVRSGQSTVLRLKHVAANGGIVQRDF